MNTEFIDGLIMPVIVAGCFCIGYIVKKWMPTDDKWIPTIVGIVGGILGFILTEEPGKRAIVTGIVAGAISGLASTGVHQLIKQHLKLPDLQTNFNDDERLIEVEEDETEEDTAEE